MKSKMPMQPIRMTENGIIRFKENKIVSYLLDAGPFDLNMIARLPGITEEEHAQFAQLIGYTVSGYGDLSYALNVKEADEIAEKIIKDLKDNE